MRKSLEGLIALDAFWASRAVRWGAVLLTFCGFWIMARQIYEAGHNRDIDSELMTWGIVLTMLGLGTLRWANPGRAIEDVTTGIARVKMAILGRRADDPKVVEAPVDVQIVDELPPDPAAEAKAQEEADDRPR